MTRFLISSTALFKICKGGDKWQKGQVDGALCFLEGKKISKLLSILQKITYLPPADYALMKDDFLLEFEKVIDCYRKNIRIQGW